MDNTLFLLWQNYAQRQEDFAQKNSKYTKEFGDDQQQAVKDARDIPNEAIRRSIPKDVRDALITASTNAPITGRSFPGSLKVLIRKVSGALKKRWQATQVIMPRLLSSGML